MKKLCEVQGCENKSNSRNLCATHYRRWLRHGNAETKLKIPCRPIKINKKINMLTIIEEVDAVVTKKGIKKRMVLCECDCGKSKIIEYHPVLNGSTKSCGCLNHKKSIKEITPKIRNVSKGLGLSKTQFYASHHAMKQRCKNKNNPGYKHYGGRGITYCEKWKTIAGFAEDMYESYRPGLTLERINVDGNYCKENCEWIPKNMQGINKRNTLRITHNGITKRLSEWAEEFGIKKVTMYERYSKGWSFEQITSTIKLNRYR